MIHSLDNAKSIRHARFRHCAGINVVLLLLYASISLHRFAELGALISVVYFSIIKKIYLSIKLVRFVPIIITASTSVGICCANTYVSNVIR